jgi:hypothetical protein
VLNISGPEEAAVTEGGTILRAGLSWDAAWSRQEAPTRAMTAKVRIGMILSGLGVGT